MFGGCLFDLVQKVSGIGSFQQPFGLELRVCGTEFRAGSRGIVSSVGVHRRLKKSFVNPKP